MGKKIFLVLEDGMVFPGTAFGSEPPKALELKNDVILDRTAGEVVFNTGMTGYHEILTDPSYSGQIVVMTYPHIGNYGCDNSWSEVGPAAKNKERTISVSALVIRSLYDGPLPEGRISLHNFLDSHNICGITDIDTRALTIRIRDLGSPRGILVQSGSDSLTKEELDHVVSYLNVFPVMEGRNLIENVGVSSELTLEKKNGPRFVLVDCGIKANIVRELEKRDCEVHLLPSTATSEDILGGGYDAILFSNGPGDPAVLASQVELIKKLIGNIPVFGICLGHQLISQALGAKTYKMKFGHHGVNQPVRDELTKKVFVTSQNHGFAVDEKTLPSNVKIWFTNANDKSVEGIYHTELPVKSAQFHPEACPGPHDSSWIFDSFIEAIPEKK